MSDEKYTPLLKPYVVQIALPEQGGYSTNWPNKCPHNVKGALFLVVGDVRDSSVPYQDDESKEDYTTLKLVRIPVDSKLSVRDGQWYGSNGREIKLEDFCMDAYDPGYQPAELIPAELVGLNITMKVGPETFASRIHS